MRTTIDLPEDVLRRAKSVAALKGISLKALIGAFVESGLAMSSQPTSYGHRTPLPDLVPATKTPIRLLSNDEIEDILFMEDRSEFDRNRPT